tara:strand:+ start:257 stop:889 length:633 start_codon:yes stop_codon:yes gene_type:complete
MNDLVENIHETLSRSVCQGWDRSFLTSILGQLEDKAPLTGKQTETLHKILHRNSANEESRHQEWAPTFRNEYQETALVLAHYHVKQHYFYEISKAILNGEIPCRKKYLRMHNNKYSQKVLREFKKEPRLEMGTHVKPRSAFNSFKNVEMHNGGEYESERDTLARFAKHGAFVVGVEKYVTSAARGAKRYRLLAPGRTHIFIVEERFLKRV